MSPRLCLLLLLAVGTLLVSGAPATPQAIVRVYISDNQQCTAATLNTSLEVATQGCLDISTSEVPGLPMPISAQLTCKGATSTSAWSAGVFLGAGCSAMNLETVTGTDATSCSALKAKKEIQVSVDCSGTGKADCQVGPWSSWSSCSTTCGAGVQERARSVLAQPTGGGASCPSLKETRVCTNTELCRTACVVSDWSEWSTCDKQCGGGSQTRTRQVKTPAANGGTPCPTLSESQPCNTASCTSSCTLSDWSAFTACSAKCGGGQRTRTRTIVKPAANGGSCESLTDVQPCNEQPCAASCVTGEWSIWSPCSASCGGGLKVRHRDVQGGENCGEKTQSEPCNTQACPVDCVHDPWSEWSACSLSCGGGVKTRSRTIKTPASGTTGAKCGPLKQSTTCKNEACPSDCVVSGWSAFTTCSATCGTGMKSRHRSVVTPGVSTGTPCPALVEEVECNKQACPSKCKVSVWGDWSPCSASCGNSGTRSRSRTVVEPSSTGEPCPPLSETEKCNTQPCPVDCQVSEFTPWSTCSSSCGGGVQKRERSVLTQSSNGGKPCPSLIETRDCSTTACTAAQQGCDISPWESWSANCSKACGDGLYTRYRTVSKPECGAAMESWTCNSQPCPFDCKFEWGPLSPCDVTCGGGYQVQTAKIVEEPMNGGKPCPNPLTRKIYGCANTPCHLKRDCEVSPWSSWSRCSSSCDTGVQTRARVITATPLNGGKACPTHLVERRNCTYAPCPINCRVSTWSPWSKCDGECGIGTQKRTRTMIEPAQWGGKCGRLYDERKCVLDKVCVNASASSSTGTPPPPPPRAPIQVNGTDKCHTVCNGQGASHTPTMCGCGCCPSCKYTVGPWSPCENGKSRRRKTPSARASGCREIEEERVCCHYQTSEWSACKTICSQQQMTVQRRLKTPVSGESHGSCRQIQEQRVCRTSATALIEYDDDEEDEDANDKEKEENDALNLSVHHHDSHPSIPHPWSAALPCFEPLKQHFH